MTVPQMVREINGLASGTLAKLFGTANYEAIDRRLVAWVSWVQAQGSRRWDSWVDCWEDYRLGMMKRQMGK